MKTTMPGHVEPTPAQLEALVGLAAPGPIVMINLLRYRDAAAYPDGHAATPCTGREAYQRYGEGVAPLLEAAGGRIVWLAGALATVIGPEAERWDDAVLVEYPSADAFRTMVADPRYVEVGVHRTAALADSRLIATRTAAVGAEQPRVG